MKPSVSCTESLLQRCLPFPQINLRVKTRVKPRKTAYCGSGMRGERNQNLRL